MKVYPISVPRKDYRGGKAAVRAKVAAYNADAERLESHLNGRIRDDPSPIQTYIYGYIALELGMPLDRIRDILFGVDCGHNGLTVAKSVEAWRQFMGQ